jgi:hypothetical protein
MSALPEGAKVDHTRSLDGLDRSGHLLLPKCGGGARHYRMPSRTARPKMAMACLQGQISKKAQPTSSRRSRTLCWGGSQSAPVLLQADNVGGAKPAIFAIPRLGRVFASILFGDRPRLKKSFVPLSILVHRFHIRIFSREEIKEGRKKDI